jgi:hypothetical protein
MVIGITMLGFALLLVACDPRADSSTAKNVSEINSIYPLDSAIRFDDAWDAAYAYVHSVPVGFIDARGSADSLIYMACYRRTDIQDDAVSVSKGNAGKVSADWDRTGKKVRGFPLERISWVGAATAQSVEPTVEIRFAGLRLFALLRMTA